MRVQRGTSITNQKGTGDELWGRGSAHASGQERNEIWDCSRLFRFFFGRGGLKGRFARVCSDFAPVSPALHQR